jgi:Domain of unknown function (DUF4124)
MRYFRMTAGAFWRSASCAALLVCASTLPAQEIYKSVDAQGNTVYSDRAPTKNAPTTAVHVTEPDPAEVARLAKQQQLLNASDREREKQDAAAAKNRAALEHKQQANCENARNKYYRYKDSGRIYQRDADGNRIYYTDSEADALREQARRAMATACGS